MTLDFVDAVTALTGANLSKSVSGAGDNMQIVALRLVYSGASTPFTVTTSFGSTVEAANITADWDGATKVIIDLTGMDRVFATNPVCIVSPYYAAPSSDAVYICTAGATDATHVWVTFYDGFTSGDGVVAADLTMDFNILLIGTIA